MTKTPTTFGKLETEALKVWSRDLWAAARKPLFLSGLPGVITVMDDFESEPFKPRLKDLFAKNPRATHIKYEALRTKRRK